MIALTLLALSLGPLRNETHSLAYRPKMGEITKTSVVAIYKVGGPTVEVRYELRTEVLEVARDGTYRAKVEISSKAYREEKKPEIRNEGVDEWEARYNARGEELPDEESDGDEEDDPVNDLMRLAVGYEPKAPVTLGESWTPPMDERLNLYPLKYSLVGSGPYQGRTELMIEGKGPGRDGANLDVKIWIDAQTFARRKAIVRITEAPTRTGNDGDVLVTIESQTVS